MQPTDTLPVKKPGNGQIKTKCIAAKFVNLNGETSYIVFTDIDSLPDSDIIRRHLAKQGTLADTVKTADCELQ